MPLARRCADYGAARAILLDSWQEGVPGGTGKTFDWALAGQPLPAAGRAGWRPRRGNVGAAMRALRPAAVDVSGGVSCPGAQGCRQNQRFIAAVRAADALIDGAVDEQ